MKFLKIALSAILLSVLFLSPLNSQIVQEFSAQSPGDLIWSDEFEGTGVPDTLKWEQLEYNRRKNDNGPDGWWSKEDSYLDGNGNLVIRLRQIENRNEDDDTCDYSVGAIRTLGKYEQLYGRFEIRCKLPTQPGWWVDYWMMQGDVGGVGNGGVDGTEVDILEAFGWTDHIQNAFHWDGYGADHRSTHHSVYPAGIREGFHTFSMEWYPEIYIFYIDGEETWRTTGGGVCNQPGYIKVTGELSTEPWAISQSWADHPSKAVYPDSFVIDYVRVYELGEFVNVEPSNAAKQFKLFPNPGQDQLTIQWDPKLFQELPEVSFFDASGRNVKSFKQVRYHSPMTIDDLSSGIYFIRVKQGKNLEYHKFLKE